MCSMLVARDSARSGNQLENKGKAKDTSLQAATKSNEGGSKRDSAKWSKAFGGAEKTCRYPPLYSMRTKRVNNRKGPSRRHLRGEGKDFSAPVAEQPTRHKNGNYIKNKNGHKQANAERAHREAQKRRKAKGREPGGWKKKKGGGVGGGEKMA